MQFLTPSHLAIAALFFTPSLPTQRDEIAPDEPPGMVSIPGGRTKIGTSMKDMKKLIEEHAEAQEKAGGFLAEVPDHTVNVEEYYLMVTEVTNEQYREYVKAAGTRPPFLWGTKSIRAAWDAINEEYRLRREKAEAEGKDPGPRPEKFDELYWWEQNWKKAEWEMPEDIAKKPVVYVDYQDARGYAAWAGLRLPTEFEFERAVKGDTDRRFAWGDDWDKEAAVTKESKSISDCQEVASRKKGVSPQGVFDLNGNVWEWTSSPYVEYPGFKHEKFNVGKGDLRKEINSIPKWSPDRRVVRSGSQQTGFIFARASTRGGFDRYQQASVFGFRCAASKMPGLDFARTLLSDIPNEIRPRDSKGPVVFLPEDVTAMDRWAYTEGTAAAPGYQVITSYDYILFTPAEEAQTNGLADMEKASQDDEVTFMGFLSTNKDMVEPALRAGTYLVAIRGKGKFPDRKPKPTDEEGKEGEPVEAGAKANAPDDEDGPTKLIVENFLEIDPLVNNYIFIDMAGTPVASMIVPELDYGSITPTSPLGAFVVDKKVTIQIPGKKEGETESVEISQKWLDVKYFVKGKSRKGVKATLSLRFGDGVIEGDWRRSKKQ